MKNGGAVDFAAALAAIRNQLSELDAEVVRVTRARVSRVEAIGRIDAALDGALAGVAGGWSWRAAANGFSAASPPMRPAAALVPAQDARPWEVCSWLLATFPEHIRELLIANLPDDADALPTAERTKKLAALAEERLDLERREERLIMTAEAAGVRLERRGDLSPSVFLETTL